MMATLKKAILFVAPVLVGLMFMSCMSDSTEPMPQVSSGVAITEGVPGGTFVETRTMTATVTDVDTEERRVTLKTPDGNKFIVKCGPEVANFDQIDDGDRIKITHAEELVVSMAEEGTAPSDTGSEMVEVATMGGGRLAASTMQVTATVTAIDRENRKVTLKFADSSTATFTVREDVDLTKRKVGEKVVIRKTEALALSIEEV